jgi:two-component system, cell cycle response regulator DivK
VTRKKAKPGSGARAKPDPEKARSTGRRRQAAPLILVVDDFKDGRELVTEMLSFHGFRVAEAADGQEALAKAKALQPDAILMDLSLPGVDGWEVTRRLRADAATAAIKIIALTAHAQADALGRARRAGADATITKPCLPDEVVTQVRAVLAVRGATAGEGA